MVNQTGCLPSCDRHEIAIKTTTDIRTWPGGNNPTMTLVFQFEDGSYDVREEYIVYGKGACVRLAQQNHERSSKKTSQSNFTMNPKFSDWYFMFIS